MATGSCTSPVVVRAAEEPAGRAGVFLVPSPDLLVQTVAARRRAGAAAAGPRGVLLARRGGGPCCHHRSDRTGRWGTRTTDRPTVFAAYASTGLGTVERAPAAGLPGLTPRRPGLSPPPPPGGYPP